MTVAPRPRRALIPEAAAIVLLTVALTVQLLVEPIAGMANNGDFERLMSAVGLRSLAATPHDHYFAFVEPRYGLDGGERWSGYVSSEVPLVALAAGLARAVGARTMDIRVLGAVNATALLLAVAALLAASRRRPGPVRWVIAGFVVVVASDVGYVAYLDSLYSEPASLVFFVLTLALALVTALGAWPRWSRGGLAVSFFAAAALLVTAKIQNFALAVPLAALGAWLFRPVATGDRGTPRRALSVGLALALLLLGAGYQRFGQHRWLVDANLYNALFHDLLPLSDDPGRDLAELGLDPSFAALRGTTSGENQWRITDPAFRAAVLDRIGVWRVVAFELRHPAHLARMARVAAAEAFRFRPSNLGTFAREAGRPPGARTASFAHWSAVKGALARGGAPLFGAFFLVNVVVLAVKALRFDRSRAERDVTAIHACLLVMAPLQFATVTAGAGLLDAVKQLFLFNALCDACLGLLLAYAAVRLTRPRPEVSAPAR
jgi:hypothetical protein